jgi:hypothetical protein
MRDRYLVPGGELRAARAASGRGLPRMLLVTAAGSVQVVDAEALTEFPSLEAACSSCGFSSDLLVEISAAEAMVRNSIGNH